MVVAGRRIADDDEASLVLFLRPFRSPYSNVTDVMAGFVLKTADSPKDTECVRMYVKVKWRGDDNVNERWGSPQQASRAYPRQLRKQLGGGDCS